jgi:2-polyprenyl-6-methoxyphenol hydroxylase-like FAD-dependent oxidoreductase
MAGSGTVIVVGAGPTGLALAAELALAGTQVRVLDRPAGLRADAYGDLSDRGMLLVFPFRDGSCRTVLYDYARAGVAASEPVTLDEVRTSLVRVTGQDFGPRDMTWSGRYRSESRPVPQYRAGRILLAGDAAHTHSPAGGGQDPVRRVRYRRCQGARLPAAVLARPDGYIAWASDEHEASLRPGQARAAVRAWCGSA